MTQRVYHDVPIVMTDSVYAIDFPDSEGVSSYIPDSEGVSSYIIDVRGAMEGIGERPGPAPAYWGIDLVAEADTFRLSLRHGNSDFGDIHDRRQSFVTLTHGGETLYREDVGGFESSSGVYNTLRLEIDCGRQNLRLSGGGKRVEELAEIPFAESFAPLKARLWSRGELTVSSLFFETNLSPSRVLASKWNESALMDYMKESTDGVEGYWQYLDRENDPQYARPGGRYLLALVKSDDEEGGYDIVYVDGAEVHNESWRPMMLKGRLKPTIFVGHYNLEWIDSTFEPIDRDIHASITDGSILTLSFPLLKTTLRFSRMPLAK